MARRLRFDARITRLRQRAEQPVCRISLVSASSSRTIIENTANIYFDFNPPVITEQSVLVAEFGTGVGAADERILQVYPNPTDDRITVVVPEPMRVVLHDATGRVVLAARLGQGSQELGLQGLGPGVYALTATSGTGASFTRRITKR